MVYRTGPTNAIMRPVSYNLYPCAGFSLFFGCGFCTSGRRDTYLRPRASTVGCCGCHVKRQMRSENLKTEELHGAPSRPPSSRLPVSVTDGGADGYDSPSRQSSSGRRSKGRMAGWGRERPVDARIRARARDLQAHRLLITPATSSSTVVVRVCPRRLLRFRSAVTVSHRPFCLSRSTHRLHRSRSLPSVFPVHHPPPVLAIPCPPPCLSRSTHRLHRSRSLPSVFPVHHPPPVLASHRRPLSSSLSLSLHPSASPIPLPSQDLGLLDLGVRMLLLSKATAGQFQHGRTKLIGSSKRDGSMEEK
ncbi:hypothetical protein ACLOJK_013520 [Asimina triloba]